MDTMAATCSNCGKQYQPKRGTSKFCSDACRVKSHKQEKKATVASASVDEVLPIEQAWIPTRRESLLNKVVSDLLADMAKISWFVEQLESSTIVDEALTIAARAIKTIAQDEVVQEVDYHDMCQKIYDVDGFVARIGLALPGRRPIG